MDPSRGRFLDTTFRLHPEICRFTSELFYDNLLRSRPELQLQRIEGCRSLDGSGLRYLAAPHYGNQNQSPEEAEYIRTLVDSLLAPGVAYVNAEGERTAVTLADILIVAPYNAQVRALLDVLPQGARVGTVDRFQGQQAPVAIYSLTTSTPDDAPRGMEFLYDLHRLNVATSRARALSILVASPALLEPNCKTPQQLRLANALCRLVELAAEKRAAAALVP
jgi:uncharacterized protein